MFHTLFDQLLYKQHDLKYMEMKILHFEKLYEILQDFPYRNIADIMILREQLLIEVH